MTADLAAKNLNISKNLKKNLQKPKILYNFAV